MPGVKTVKGKYFSGTGSRGFWSEEKLDSLGRTIERSSYRKKKLTGTYVLQYNDRNDIILRIDTYDINHPGTADTSRYEYSYNNDIIAFEIYIYTSNDSAIYKLINNEGDSILTYQYTSYHNLADRKNIHSNAETYVLSYKNNLLTKLEITNNKNEKEISEYTYYPNGNVKRRVKKRIPELDDEIVYTGGPGGDDQSYKYRYNRKGRTKTLYMIVHNKTYKIATYKYK